MVRVDCLSWYANAAPQSTVLSSVYQNYRAINCQIAQPSTHQLPQTNAPTYL